ncbi:hypothetical protein CWI36_0781p0020 [Hamiltosporidium magnivora]|uniref:Uncharacterized protein n=1 Tax=Hamiltosporidium magnivora TaxID=148818 RepID=A0A4Q9LBS4_9MICR|nr:hypothetical protein CWI36_0781p0020 [Hamiltosporidium magnivora]
MDKITTTQKLILAYAVNIYGKSSDIHIKNYIFSKADFNVNLYYKWREIYIKLENESKENGYASVVEYCEDIRYKKMVEMYEENYRERIKLLEKKKFVFENEEKKNESKMFKRNVVSGILIENKSFNRECHLIDRNTIIVGGSIVAKEEGKNIEKDEKYCEGISEATVYENRVSNGGKEILGENEVRSKVDLSENSGKIKLSNRYYWKMNDSERDFDDYLDKVAEKYENMNYSLHDVVPNVFRVEYPTTFAKDTKDVLDVLSKKAKSMEYQNKRNKVGIYIDDPALEELIRKVSGTKTISKDRTLWVGEFKLLLKSLEQNIKHDSLEKTKILKNGVISISSEVKLESGLTNSLFKVMMLLQNLIFDTKNNEIIKVCAEYKNYFYSFFDFYRK